MSSDEDELARIRKRKMEKLIQQQQQREAVDEAIAEREKERERVIQSLFFPDALDYLKELEKTKPQLGRRIEDIAITLFLRQQLTTRITKEGVMLVQRRLEGVESKIMVKRRGEDTVSFYDAVRKDLEEFE